jgi:Skp family chaperone for outer membrane proteins
MRRRLALATRLALLSCGGLRLGLVVTLAALTLTSVSTGPVAAQSVAAVPQVLTLDQNRLYAESLYGKAMEAKALAASQTLASENRKIEADLAAEEAELTQKRATMAATAFQTLADEFDAKVERLRKDQAAKVAALNAQRDAGRTTFFQAAVPVLGDLMKQLGAFAILNHDAVVLAFDSIDVTDRAIAAVNARLGDGTALPNGPRLQPGTTTTDPAPDQTADPAANPAPNQTTPAP